ncbi:hypothetical protein [Amycolatopsis sp. NPDC051372]|uniref:hypothetical protein n=1 Tax=Amycolatopsis sp. NPDC051372 TaxID=3155669 RepID=UPI0034266435
MIDIVDRIDEVTAPACGWCSKPLSPMGASLYFCDIDPSRSSEQQCQYRWHAERSDRLVGYREAGHDFFADAVRTLGNRTQPVPGTEREWREFGHVVDGPPSLMFTPAGRPGRSPAEILCDITIDLRPFIEAINRATAQLARAVALPLPLLLGQPVDDETAMLGAEPSEFVVDEPYRAEQMRAALEARRNRNTGPRQQPRAPKRIDARRTR